MELGSCYIPVSTNKRNNSIIQNSDSARRKVIKGEHNKASVTHKSKVVKSLF